MSKPLVVVIPHQLGQAGARARLADGIERLRSGFGSSVGAVDHRWTDDHLDLAVSVMGQSVRSGLDVADDHVRLEVHLPWMLAMLANRARGLLEKEGQLLLGKPKG